MAVATMVTFPVIEVSSATFISIPPISFPNVLFSLLDIWVFIHTSPVPQGTAATVSTCNGAFIHGQFRGLILPGTGDVAWDSLDMMNQSL